MRRTRRTVAGVFDNPILVGTITILVVVVAVYLSYIAENGLPDGVTFRLNTTSRRNHDRPFVDLDTAFAAFGAKTQRGLRWTIAQLGDVVSGRGSQFNDAIHSTSQLIGPLEDLLRLFASPSTNVSGFISGLASTTSALAPVAPTLFGPLMSNAA